MKLLFDQNLSPRLVEALDDLFPRSAHVQSLGYDRSQDTALWDFARDNDFVIVTKDVDFSDRSALLGHPPKVAKTHSICMCGPLRACPAGTQVHQATMKDQNNRSPDGAKGGGHLFFRSFRAHVGFA